MTRIEEIEQKLCEMERELKNTVNAIEENIGNEIDDLRGALAELKESKKEGKWLPKEGEYYWYRDSWGDFKTCKFANKENLQWRYNNVPMFPNVEKSKRYWHFRDTVKEKSYEFSKEEIQDSSIYKFSIGYVPSNNRFYISYDADCKYFGKIYFKTEEDAQYIIDNFKEELMEYWI